MLRAGTILLDSNAGTYVDKVLESVTSVKAVKLRQSMHDEQKKKNLADATLSFKPHGAGA